MTTSDDRTAIRRSALESVHAALGAQWMAPDVHYPAAYLAGAAGAPSTVEPPVGLAEIGPREVASLGGAALRQALAAAGLPFVLGRVSTAGALEVWGVAPDEALLTWASAAPGASAVDPRPALRRHGAAVTDVGAGLVQLRLRGPRLAGLLQELCPVDLSDRALSDGGIVQAPFAGVRVTLARQDRGGAAAVTLLAPRDLAEYLWEVITDAGAHHGLRPVVDAGAGS